MSIGTDLVFQTNTPLHGPIQGDTFIVFDVDPEMHQVSEMPGQSLLLLTAPGPRGNPGAAGNQVELRRSPAGSDPDGVEWHYVGENLTDPWKLLIPVEDITGPQGPVGPYGNDSHIQDTAADTWLITHSIPYQPSLTILDSSGRVVEGDVTYLSATQIQVEFSAPFAGVAYMS